MSDTDVSRAACVACHGALSVFGRRIGYVYHRCSGCGTIQLYPLPTREELSEAYRKQYATAGHCRSDVDEQTGAARPYYRSLSAALKTHGAKGKILEVGTGWGGLCEALLADGYDCQGIDLSEDMVAHCKSRGLPVDLGDLWSVDPAPRGALVLSAVFEHLVDHDAWLRQAGTLLDTGGLFVSMQPTAPFAAFMGRAVRLGLRNVELPQLHQVFCPPWHTVLFSIQGMARLMDRHGFELLEVRRGPQARGTGLIGAAQLALETINRVGWPLLRERWPLVISHIFIFRKTRRQDYG